MNLICVWCGLPSGEVPLSCKNHGRDRADFPDDPTGAERSAAFLAKIRGDR